MIDEVEIDNTDKLDDDELDFSDGQNEMYEHFRLTVDKGQRLLRIDKFIQMKIENASRSKIQTAADAGYIIVNGKPVKSSYKVKPDDVIQVMLAHPPTEINIIPENIPLNIVYEDDSFVIVNKPAGMVVHPSYGHYTGTLINALAYKYIDLPIFNGFDARPGLVHRIDMNTSGLLVVAKSEQAKMHISKQFFYHTSHRRYVALVWGNFAEDSGRIEGNIGRDPRDRQRMAVFPPGSETGKSAITHYQVLERYGYTTLVECRLETGRTHQIRAHMKHIGHPLFADERYGGMEILRGERTASYKAYIQNCMKICGRQALHAKTLGFVHPTTHEQMDFTSELADDMKELLEKWRKYIKSNNTL